MFVHPLHMPVLPTLWMQTCRLLIAGDSVILLFGLDDILERCSDLCEALLSSDAGVVWSSHGIAPFFQPGASARPSLLRKPVSIVFATSDRYMNTK